MDDLATMLIDNEAAKHAIIKGYCRERAMCNLLGCFWCLCGHTGLTPWMERVTSEANPSDEISRDVWEMVFAEHWTVFQINLQPVIKIQSMRTNPLHKPCEWLWQNKPSHRSGRHTHNCSNCRNDHRVWCADKTANQPARYVSGGAAKNVANKCLAACAKTIAVAVKPKEKAL